MRPKKSDPRDATFQKKLVKTASKGLVKNEALVSLKELWEADCPSFAMRLAKNDTAPATLLQLGRIEVAAKSMERRSTVA